MGENVISEKELTVKAKLENLDTVIGFLEEELEGAECPMKISLKIQVCLEELFVNVANYAYGDSEGECTIGIITKKAEDKYMVTVRIEDSGKPFNPLEKEDPDITLSAEERQIGGLGIYMVKKTMDDVYYENNGKNIFTMVKSW